MKIASNLLQNPDEYPPLGLSVARLEGQLKSLVSPYAIVDCMDEHGNIYRIADVFMADNDLVYIRIIKEP